MQWKIFKLCVKYFHYSEQKRLVGKVVFVCDTMLLHFVALYCTASWSSDGTETFLPNGLQRVNSGLQWLGYSIATSDDTVIAYASNTTVARSLQCHHYGCTIEPIPLTSRLHYLSRTSATSHTYSFAAVVVPTQR